MAESKPKKKVVDIVIDSFLKRVEEEGVMPWQNPHKFGVSINWVSKKMYRGLNRMILPCGEYMTKNQLNKYNEEHNEDFKFQKGIEWFPVVFYSQKQFRIKAEDVNEELEGRTLEVDQGFVNSKGHKVVRRESGYFSEYFVMKYSLVAEIRHFKNSKGETLPRRIGDSEDFDLMISKEEPQKVLENYIKRSGIKYEEYNDGMSYYNPQKDLVHINKTYKWASAKYSTAFHEFAHSTGHASRLDRIGVTSSDGFAGARYSVEECIAEMTSALLCQETGISDFVTSGTLSETNSLAYVQSWSKAIRDFGSKFPSICRQAEQAYLYILGEDESAQVDGNSTTER